MDSNTDPAMPLPNEKVMPANWLVSGGKMSELIRSMDWSATPLGSLDTWPQGLRTAVNLILASSFPMAILWGTELTFIYNDTYRAIAADRHPRALGQSTREAWPEVWEFNKPLFERVMTRGETVHLEDQLFRIVRRGFIEDAYFTVSYSPMRTEGSQVAGTLVVLLETTPRVSLERRLKQAKETLEVQLAERKRAVEELARIFDLVPDLICVASTDGYFKKLNPAWEKTLGFTINELLSKPYADFIHPDDLVPTMIAVEKLMANQSSINFVNRYRCKDGSYKWLEWNAIPSPDGIALYAAARDFTQRRQAERREFLSAEILDIINDSPVLDDTIGAILTVIKRETGVAAAGIRLRSGDDFPYFSQDGFSGDFLLAENELTARDRDGRICRDAKGDISLDCTCGLVLSGRTDPTIPFFTQGGSFWTNDSAPLLDLPADQDPRLHPRNRCIHEGFLSVALIPIRANQAIVGLLQLNDREKDRFTLEMIHYFERLAASIGIALTRKQAEEALRKSEEKNREILESISDAFFSLDDNMVVKYFNHAAERMLNRKASDIIGRRLFDAFPKARGSVFEENYTQCIRTKTALSFEAELAVAPYENWYDVRVFPEKNGIAVFFQVITERKRAEEQIRVLNEQLQHQVADLAAANNELDSFTYSVSHDLRAPVRNIDGLSRILINKYREKLDETGREYLARVRKASSKMDQLISDLLNLSHASRQNLETADVDLGNIASDIVASLRENNPDRKVELSIASGLKAVADPHLIRIALDNLIGNAWKFTLKKENVRIEFGAFAKDGKTVYYVRDNGAGFESEYAEKMFRPFERLPSATEFEGTGIGLAIVERIIRRQGGKVWAEGEVGKGATFYFTLSDH